MPQPQFIKGYREDHLLRKSFNELAAQIFGIHFENWYEKGFWTDKYEQYSFADDSRIIANVSVNKLDLIINGEIKKAIQIGTVMTHPDYRNQGLSARLMKTALADVEEQCDFIYLFANPSVLDFYPKFGFQARDEYQYTLDFRKLGDGAREQTEKQTEKQAERRASIRRLDGRRDEDLRFIYDFAADRLPVSRRLGTGNAAELLMFYCMYVFQNDLYYVEKDDVLVICKQDQQQFNLFDVVSRSEVEIDSVILQLAQEGTTEVVFHFTPDNLETACQKTIYQGNEVLFVKSKGDSSFPEFSKHPLTAQA